MNVILVAEAGHLWVQSLLAWAEGVVTPESSVCGCQRRPRRQKRQMLDLSEVVRLKMRYIVPEKTHKLHAWPILCK